MGIDPGLTITGWGVINASDNRISYVAHGAIHPVKDALLADRLADLYTKLSSIVKTYNPTEAAVEETFVNKNPESALKLGHARGIALLVPAHAGLYVEEYSATKVKKTVVGTGHADKKQVELMVKKLLPTAPSPQKDAADALAIAICHATYRQARNSGLML